MTNVSTFPNAAGGVDAGLRRYLINVYNHMAGALVVSGLVGYGAIATGFYRIIFGTPLFWVVLIAPLAVVMFLSFRINKMSLGAAQLAFWSYAGLVGLSLSAIFLVYTGASITKVFLITAATFGAMSLYGYTTKADLSRIGAFLAMALVGVIIASLVNLFLRSPGFQFAISIVGVVVFVGLTAWDTQRIKAIYLESDDAATAGKKAVMGALALYLDFLNIFLLLLQLFGDRRR